MQKESFELGPLHMSPVDRAGSVTGMNFALGSYEKFQPGVTVIWASPRFGHPNSHIPSVLGIPKTMIASTLPKLFQTGEKSGLSITNLRLNSVDAC